MLLITKKPAQGRLKEFIVNHIIGELKLSLSYHTALLRLLSPGHFHFYNHKYRRDTDSAARSDSFVSWHYHTFQCYSLVYCMSPCHEPADLIDCQNLQALPRKCMYSY